MRDRMSALESRVEQLGAAIARLESRISEIERKSIVPRTPPEEILAKDGEIIGERREPDVAGTLSLAGKTLLALGGAYLLRSLTEAGAVAPGLGIALGLAYAAFWIYMAHRAARKGRGTSAAFHAAAGALVAYPLVWETTVRLRLLGPGTGALLLFGFSLCSLLVAWRWKLASAAWVIALAYMATAFALMGGTRSVVLYSGVVVALSAVGLVLGYSDDWSPLHRTTTIVADLAVLLCLFGASIRSDATSAAPAVSVALGLFLAHAGGFFHRSVVRGREPSVFDMVQASLATLIGYAGAVAIAAVAGPSWLVRAFGVGAALLGYEAALRRIRGPEIHRARLLLMSLALVALLAATAALPVTATLWTLLAIVALSLGRWAGNATLRLHGALYLLAAAVSSGLFLRAVHAFLVPASVSWPDPNAESLVVLLAALAVSASESFDRSSGTLWRPASTFIALLVTFAGGGAALMYTILPLASGGPGGGVDPAHLAALRTGVLSAAAVLLGALAGRRVPAAGWLLYPVLMLGGMKLVWEDFPRGRAESLFLALACYGAALILAPRLARGRCS